MKPGSKRRTFVWVFALVAFTPLSLIFVFLLGLGRGFMLPGLVSANLAGLGTATRVRPGVVFASSFAALPSVMPFVAMTFVEDRWLALFLCVLVAVTVCALFSPVSLYLPFSIAQRDTSLDPLAPKSPSLSELTYHWARLPTSVRRRVLSTRLLSLILPALVWSFAPHTLLWITVTAWSYGIGIAAYAREISQAAMAAHLIFDDDTTAPSHIQRASLFGPALFGVIGLLGAAGLTALAPLGMIYVTPSNVAIECPTRHHGVTTWTLPTGVRLESLETGIMVEARDGGGAGLVTFDKTCERPPGLHVVREGNSDLFYVQLMGDGESRESSAADAVSDLETQSGPQRLDTRPGRWGGSRVVGEFPLTGDGVRLFDTTEDRLRSHAPLNLVYLALTIVSAFLSVLLISLFLKRVEQSANTPRSTPISYHRTLFLTLLLALITFAVGIYGISKLV